jgi:hypothetical protein
MLPFVRGIPRHVGQSIMQSVIVFSLTVRQLVLSRVAVQPTLLSDAFAEREHSMPADRSRPFVQAGM